jgi:hypothetical protein
VESPPYFSEKHCICLWIGFFTILESNAKEKEVERCNDDINMYNVSLYLVLYHFGSIGISILSAPYITLVLFFNLIKVENMRY